MIFFLFLEILTCLVEDVTMALPLCYKEVESFSTDDFVPNDSLDTVVTVYDIFSFLKYLLEGTTFR
jgi:hypothetical protein